MRVTVAVSLMLVATAVTGLALPYQSAMWLSAAAVTALVCGWAAARIIYAELTQSWREATRDRAAQANAYRALFNQRADEHAAFTTAMADRLHRREQEIHELEESVLAAEKRAFEAEARVQREARRADGAAERAQELVVRLKEVERARDELEAARADAVVDLVAWEERVAAAHRPSSEEKQA